MSKLRIGLMVLTLIVPSLALASFDLNQAAPSTVVYPTIYDLIATIFTVAITLSAIGFVILLLVGGISYLTASGDPEGVKKAKGMFANAIIGLILVLAAWALGNFILARLGYHGGNADTTAGGEKIPTPSVPPVGVPKPSTTQPKSTNGGIGGR